MATPDPDRCAACNMALGLLPGRHDCQADPPDLVARRLIMHRSLWDRCVAEAARRNADGRPLTDHVLPTDVAVEALERGATWPTHHAERHLRPDTASNGRDALPFGLGAAALAEPFCACGRVVSRCDKSRKACTNGRLGVGRDQRRD